MPALLENTPRGLYCGPGDFYVDPWQSVPRAVITHAHSDHARPGSEAYLTTSDGLPIYHWRPVEQIFAAINAWLRGN